MRALGMAATVVLTLVTGSIGINVAVADETPTRQEVRDARVAVRATADTVASVQASLTVANQRLQESGIAAAQAAEAFNGARWKAAQARKAADAARERAGIAAADLERQRDTYRDALLTSYEISPQLSALSAMVHSDGIDTVLQQTATLENAEDALDDKYDEFQAASTLAGVATDQAEKAEAEAAKAKAAARTARDEAKAAADGAAAQAQAIASEKDTLIRKLADLQQVSVRLAQRRQSDLEARAAEAAAAAAQQQADEQAAAEAAAAAAAEVEAQEEAQEQADEPATEPSAEPSTEPTPDPEPTPEPTTEPTPDPPSEPAPPAPAPVAPAPASGASAAIAFARAQIGEPYVWGAAGPGSWDCSGLTMGAWAAGGKYLPHYSVAQYEQSTPISSSQLRPGDLVFWGSSSNSGSIYHVALYVGNGMIIQAPRTGVPVQEVSMYYWITPNFYARP